MTCYISGYIDVVHLFRYLRSMFYGNYTYFTRGVTMFENKGFLTNVVLLTHSTLFFTLPSFVTMLICNRGFWQNLKRWLSSVV